MGEMKDISYAADKTLIDVVEDGFSQIEEGEGFEYTIGKVRGGSLKVVFEPESPDFESVVIDCVDGFGYTLAFEA